MASGGDDGGDPGALVQGGGPLVTRRGFLAGLGAGAATLALSSCTPPGIDPGPGPAPTAPTSLLTFRRRLDQAIIDVQGWNLRTELVGGTLMLTKEQPARPAWLVFVFPPQSLLEEAFLRTGQPADDEPYLPPPVDARIAGPSRLAFEVSDELLPLPVTKEALFDWVRFTPSVVPNAVYQARFGFEPDLRRPAGFETAIEVPWWLQLSPSAHQAWAHSNVPVTRDGRTELWHTRLGHLDAGSVSEAEDPRRSVRAVWASDPGFESTVALTDPPSGLSDNVPFRASLTARDRLDLVRLSADFEARQGYTPQLVDVERLALTGLGGILDSNFTTDLPFAQGQYNSSLLVWRHLANVGRDQYVRVVRKGWLFPFGFKTVIITVSDRRFAHPGDDPSQGRGAYLRQQRFLVITGPTRDLRSAPHVPWGGKNLPFRRLECLTRVTPPLGDAGPYADGLSQNEVFQVVRGGDPYPFLIRALDWEGVSHDFGAMGVFVDDTRSYTESDVAKIMAAYNAPATDTRSGAAHPSDLGSSKVAFAAEKDPDDTRLVTRKLAFVAELPSVGGGELDPPADPATPDDLPSPDFFAAQSQPRFYPALSAADVVFAEVASAGGQSNPPPSTLSYFGGYLAHGLPATFTGSAFEDHANRGQVILALPPATGAATLATAARSTGGMAAPSLGVAAVSRVLGPTGDPDSSALGEFRPDQILDNSVKILGGVVLVEVLKAVSEFLSPDDDPDGEENQKKALRMSSERKDDPQRVETTIVWEPELQAGPPGLNLFVPLTGATCKIQVETVTNLDNAAASTTDIRGELTNFAVALFGGTDDGDPNDPASFAQEPNTFLVVPVQYVRFTGGSNLREDLDCKLGDITFHGPLKFVEQLQELMSFGGGSGIKIDVGGDGITITLTVAIPDMTFGVLSLLNMKLLVGLGIPFDGSPVRFQFGFCTRENPFTLRVWIFGGGGFVGVVVTTRGLELLEMTFEFGAGFQLSIGGLASGKVEVAAGIYFKVETVHDGPDEVQTLTLEAYLRMDGKLEVLGIITVSVHFHLKLIYTKTGEEELLEGEAVLIIEIDVLIFSGSVELKVRRTLSSSSSGGAGLQGAAHTSQAGATSGAKAYEPTLAALPQAAPPDPVLTFAANYSNPQWNTYCETFA